MTADEIIKLISVLLSLLSLLGVSTVISLFVKDKYEMRKQKKQETTKEHLEAEKLKRQTETREVLTEEFSLFKNDLKIEITTIKSDLAELTSEVNSNLNDFKNEITSLKEDLKVNTEGEVTLLRDRMHNSLKKCQELGYKTSSDKANWYEMYNSYKNLGGNHFREYVNAWKDAFDSLPTEDAHLRELNKKFNDGIH